jgi:outer membrane protein assembly factor BamD
VRPRDLEGRGRVLVTSRVLFTVLIIALLGAGCRSHRAKDDAKSGPETIYQRAQKDMKNGDYANAIKQLEGLQSRFPFSEPARQAQLDLIYVYYRSRQTDPAIDAADTFIRENPTNLRVDYAYYMKGLVYFERQPNRLERFFKADLSARPPTNTRKSFEAFGALIQKYPHSPYVTDARQRMIYLRNRLAGFELHVAQYYMRRGAFVGALNRAKYCVENYDGAPAVRGAMKVEIDAYHALKMDDLATSAERVYAANYPQDPSGADTGRSWWGGHKAGTQ